MALAPDRLALLAQRADTLLAQPADERAGWLAALGPGEADLLPHLRRLLDVATAQGDGTTALPASLRALVADSLNAAQAPTAGERIGPYRLLSLLGEGGMGVVWRAERADWTDGTAQREVALKLPFAQTGQRRWAERFARERDILARLEHPHIARLYDAGLTPQGQPWLAMALVEGTTITAFADARRLNLGARIRLFLQVLAAVQFAHAHLVVHRDLKPSNIYVDASGQVQLLDFGIALPLDDAAQSDAPLTEVGQVLLTPDYAAPEQLLRAPVSTAADIYSLGVVLFELLCGRRPHLRGGGGRAAIEQAVLHAEPTRASHAGREASIELAERRATRPATLSRQLRGDLDNILAKAMQREPTERYASAEAFAADLQRHLDGVPVLAHPGSLGYRTLKFWRRNRLSLGAAAAVALALVAGTGLALWQARQARLESRKAQAVQDFLVGIFESADPARAQGKEPTVRALLDRGASDVQQRLAGQPEVRDAVELALLRIDLRLSSFQQALPLAQARRERLRQQTGGHGAAYADALLTLASIEQGLVRFEAALAMAREGRAALVGVSDASPMLGPLLAQAEATSLGMLQRSDEAAAVLSRLIPEVIAIKGADSLEVLQMRGLWAFNLVRAGQLAPALALLDQNEPALARLPASQAIEAASMRAETGQVLWRAGVLGRAGQSMQLGIAEYDRLLGRPNTTAAALQRDLGLILLDQGDAVGALAAMQAHHQQVRQLSGSADRKTPIAEQASVLPLLALGRMAEAAALAERSLGELQAVLAASPDADLTRQPELRGMRRQWALALLFNGQPAKAEAMLQEISAQEQVAKVVGWRHAFSRSALVGAWRAQGQAEQALAAAQQVLQLASGAVPFQAQLLAVKARFNQALALADLGRHDQAQASWEQAHAALASLLAGRHPDHPLWDIAQVVHAELLRGAGQTAVAQALDASARARLLSQRQIELPQRLWLVF